MNGGPNHSELEHLRKFEHPGFLASGSRGNEAGGMTSMPAKGLSPGSVRRLRRSPAGRLAGTGVPLWYPLHGSGDPPAQRSEGQRARPAERALHPVHPRPEGRRAAVRPVSTPGPRLSHDRGGAPQEPGHRARQPLLTLLRCPRDPADHGTAWVLAAAPRPAPASLRLDPPVHLPRREPGATRTEPAQTRRAAQPAA